MKKCLMGLAAGCLMLILPVKAQDVKATLEDKPLKVYGDSVKFTATIQIEKSSVMNREGYLRIMPELGDVKFKEIHIPSSEMDNPGKNGVNVSISSSALFDEDMIGNDLEIESEWVYKDGKKNKEFSDMDDLAECCVTVGTLFSLNGQYELMNFDYTPPKSSPLKVVAQINFPLDISKYPVSENQEQIDVIGKYLKEHKDAKITIRGFASPEGTQERNETLARERAQAAKEWLVNALNERGYNNSFNKNNITVETTTEDWKGLAQLIEQSDLSDEKKNRLKEAMASTSSMKEMEEKLYSIMGDRKQLENFLRPLRRTTIVVSSENATREGYSSDEIRQINTEMMAGDVPVSSYKDIFTQEEFLNAYVQSDAQQGKLTILSNYNEVYPGDMRVYSDLGALMAVDLNALDIVGGDDALVGVGFNRDVVDIDEELDIDENKFKYKYKYKQEDVEDPEKFKLKVKADLENMQKAGVFIQKAVEADGNNFVALNNLGAWYLTQGEYEIAKKHLEKSYSLDPSQQGVNYNLGVLYARQGDVEKALQHFEKVEEVDVVGYNRGIARYLTGDYEGAQNDFIQFANENPDYAIGHYLVAVAAAQTGDKDLMLESLRSAVTINKKLADVAEEDLAFASYWDDDDFEEASDDDLAEK